MCALMPRILHIWQSIVRGRRCRPRHEATCRVEECPGSCLCLRWPESVLRKHSDRFCPWRCPARWPASTSLCIALLSRSFVLWSVVFSRYGWPNQYFLLHTFDYFLRFVAKVPLSIDFSLCLHPFQPSCRGTLFLQTLALRHITSAFVCMFAKHFV